MKKHKCTVEFIGGRKFVVLNQPLAYPVMGRGCVLIPAGTRNVKVAYRSSHLYRIDESGNKQKLNVYISNGKMYHA